MSISPCTALPRAYFIASFRGQLPLFSPPAAPQGCILKVRSSQAPLWLGNPPGTPPSHFSCRDVERKAPSYLLSQVLVSAFSVSTWRAEPIPFTCPDSVLGRWSRGPLHLEEASAQLRQLRWVIPQLCPQAQAPPAPTPGRVFSGSGSWCISHPSSLGVRTGFAS